MIFELRLVIFKSKDVLEAVDIKKHVLREIVNCLPPYADMVVSARSAIHYNLHDLYFIAIVVDIKSSIGMPFKSISKFSQALFDYIMNNRSSIKGTLFLCMATGKCTQYGTSKMSDSDAAIVFNVENSVNKIADFIGFNPSQGRLRF